MPRSRARVRGFGSTHRAASARHRWLPVESLICGVTLAIGPASVCAQSAAPVLVGTVEANLTSSDNGGLSPAGSERRELIASLRPKLVMSRRGAGFELDLEAAATLLGYAHGTQRGGVLPDLRAALKSTVIERLLFLDAAAQVRQSEADPFGPRVNDALGANRRTEGSYRLSPYIERQLSAHASLLARHDASLTTNAAGAGTRLVSNRSLLAVEHKPVPLGGAVELSRLDNESHGVSDSRFTLETARLRGNAALGSDVVIGAVVGRDRSRFLLSDHSDSLYGVTAEWNPGPRTEFSARAEHRFFGSGGELVLRHRMPIMSFSLTMSRDPVTSSTTLARLGAGSDLGGFLDAILTTRYPDPAVRAGLVTNIVNSRGLDTRTPNPVDIVAEYPQLQSSVKATWVALGTRNTASITLYAQTLRRLVRDGDPLPLPLAASSDSRQAGASVQFNHRLTPQLSAEATVRWSKISGLDERAGDVSEEKSYRLSLSQALSPQTGVSAGVQGIRFATTVSGLHSYDATLVFIGMNHRF